MRTKDAVGKRIEYISQTRFFDAAIGETVVALDYILLDDGTVLMFQPRDTGTDTYVVAWACANKEEGSKR